MALARDEGLDLVLVAPNAEPPVARILDYSKWRYEQRKRERTNRAAASRAETKEVQLRPNIGDHDLQTKLRRSREFLSDGHSVRVVVRLRGRQRAHPETVTALLDLFESELGGPRVDAQGPDFRVFHARS